MTYARSSGADRSRPGCASGTAIGSSTRIVRHGPAGSSRPSEITRFRTRVGQDELEAVLGRGDVQRQVRGSGPHHGVGGDDELRRTLQEDPDAGAGPDTVRGELHGQAARTPLKLSIGEVSTIRVDHRRSVRTGCGVCRDHRADGRPGTPGDLRLVPPELVVRYDMRRHTTDPPILRLWRPSARGRFGHADPCPDPPKAHRNDVIVRYGALAAAAPRLLSGRSGLTSRHSGTVPAGGPQTPRLPAPPPHAPRLRSGGRCGVSRVSPATRPPPAVGVRYVHLRMALRDEDQKAAHRRRRDGGRCRRRHG